MAGATATILIPDISGFTEFMTNTELSHSSFAISMLINSIIAAVGNEYEISEIEGDAVLMFKRGPEPTHKEIQHTCLSIFNAFHQQRMWMQQHAVCPCKACKEITNLTLKFVAHHGPVGEIKAGGFIKLSGTEVIVAHRLLKNSVPSHEYLLITENLFQQCADTEEEKSLDWIASSESYSSIGIVNYRFALLADERKKTPEPAKLHVDFSNNNTEFLKVSIAANYQDVYMVMMNIPERSEWLPSLQKVEQDMPAVFVGSIHHCTYNNYETTVSPIQMTVSDEEIIYAESCRMEAFHLILIYEFKFKKVNESNCVFASRFINTEDSHIPAETKRLLEQHLQEVAESLKAYCERG